MQIVRHEHDVIHNFRYARNRELLKAGVHGRVSNCLCENVSGEG